MSGLRPFRTIPTNLLEWAEWMREQPILVENEISITESQVSDLGDYITSSQIKTGTGSPESVVPGTIGTLYLNLSGGASTTLYVKESGDGTTTGWVAK